ncbi:DDE-type integrase/transposase/recombinase, partial [Klebsiella pneumoniae]
MMEIFWTMLASQDRKRIREYIAEQNLMVAIELDERIGYSASSLAGQPYKGRNGRVEGARELVIHPHFVLVYEVDSPWHMDETYVKVNGRWAYLYRAVDSR